MATEPWWPIRGEGRTSSSSSPPWLGLRLLPLSLWCLPLLLLLLARRFCLASCMASSSSCRIRLTSHTDRMHARPSVPARQIRVLHGLSTVPGLP